jgi:hypothetical protein
MLLASLVFMAELYVRYIRPLFVGSRMEPGARLQHDEHAASPEPVQIPRGVGGGTMPEASLTEDKASQVRRGEDARLSEGTDGCRIGMSIYRIFEAVPHADGLIIMPLVWHGPFFWSTQSHWQVQRLRFCDVVTRHLGNSAIVGCGCCRATCTTPGVARTGCLACLDRMSLRAVSRGLNSIVRRIMASQDSGRLSCACLRPLYKAPATCARQTIFDGQSHRLSKWRFNRDTKCRHADFRLKQTVCPRLVCSVEWTHCYARSVTDSTDGIKSRD